MQPLSSTALGGRLRSNAPSFQGIWGEATVAACRKRHKGLDQSLEPVGQPWPPRPPLRVLLPPPWATLTSSKVRTRFDLPPPFSSQKCNRWPCIRPASDPPGVTPATNERRALGLSLHFIDRAIRSGPVPRRYRVSQMDLLPRSSRSRPFLGAACGLSNADRP